MSITTTGPVNLDQLHAALPPCVLATTGDLTAAGATIECPSGVVTDAEISAALATIVYAPPPNVNAATLIAKGANAISSNLTYLAVASPTTAQAAAQIAALTRQVDALIRLACSLLDSTSGT